LASVKVRLFHQLRTAEGKGEVTVTAGTVGELLRALVERYGESARNVLFDAKGNFRDYAFVYINNSLQKPIDMSLPLRDGDVVLVIPPVSGGTAHPKIRRLHSPRP
jgi:molybdopterin synthase sulfur carrier subunit